MLIIRNGYCDGCNALKPCIEAGMNYCCQDCINKEFNKNKPEFDEVDVDFGEIPESIAQVLTNDAIEIIGETVGECLSNLCETVFGN